MLAPSKPMLCYDFTFSGQHLTLVKAEGQTAEQARAHAIHVACDLNIWGGSYDVAPYERRSMLQRADVKLITLGLPTTV